MQATFSTGSVTYTGTITGAASNALVVNTYTFAGFVNTGNNGTFVVTASTANALAVTNANGVNETHPGTATLIEDPDSWQRSRKPLLQNMLQTSN